MFSLFDTLAISRGLISNGGTAEIAEINKYLAPRLEYWSIGVVGFYYSWFKQYIYFTQRTLRSLR